MTAVFSDSRRQGWWRPVRGRPLRAVIIGAVCTVDLRDAAAGADDIMISGLCLVGELEILVPDGVPVETTGSAWFSSYEVDHGAVPAVPGVPAVRIHVPSLFGVVRVLRGR
ncbi:hypothetical protein ACQP26_09415 [Micromonospora sp. CA-248089]|uniref:hypothetical protein n=1 Tax=Micromonospora sp. CA-248089 TaxID=3239960 RepID=UPI003D8C9A62